MATRVISTKMAVEGEAEYRQAIKNINTELTNLNSKLGVVKSEYQNNQNSMEALSAKSEVLTEKQETLTKKVETCKNQLENARSAVDTYKDKIADTQSKLEANATAQGKLSDEVKAAGTQFNEERNKVADAEEQLKKLSNSTGDTSEEEKKLNDTIDQSKDAMQKLNDSTGGMAEQAADLQNEEAKLNQDLEENEAKLTTAESACQGYETDMNRAQTQLNNTNTEIELNDKYLEEAAESADGCATSIDQFGKNADTAGDGVEKVNNKLDIMTAQMLQRELQKVFEELMDAIFACIDAAAEFEQQMSTVEAISGATSQEMDQLSAAAKEMGATTTFTAEESAEALEYMALAGWDTNEMLDGLPSVLNLAAAAGSDLATTSDIVTDALTAFGYEASDAAEFSDTLAAASSNSNTTVEQLGSAFQKVGPLAGTMGYSVEDVSEALGLMANSGLKAESAGTALNTMLTRMSGSNSAATAELEKLNVEMYNADGTARPLSDVISDLRTAFQNMGDDTNAATEAAYNLAGQRGMAGLLSIVQSSDEDFNQLCGAVEDCNGAAEKMAETKLDNYAGQVTLLESAFDALKVEIGEQMTPAMGGVVEWLTNVVNWITDFVSEHPWVVSAIEAIAIAVGGLTVALTTMVAVKKLIDLLTNSLNLTQIAITAAVAVISGLIVGISSLISSMDKKLNPGVQESKARIDSLNDSMENYEETLEDLDTELEENAESTDFLKGAVSDLLGQEQLSNLEKIKMADYVEELNQLYPDLNLAIDETTGSLDMEADAFEEMIDAASGQAELGVYAQEQEEAERALTEATNDLAEAQREQQLVEAALEGDQDALNILYNEGLMSTDNMSDATGKLRKLDKELTGEINTETDAVDECTEAYNECTEKCDELAKSLSDMSDAEYDSYSKVGPKTEELCASLMELQNGYKDAQEAAKESAEEQFNLFDTVEKEATKSADDIMKALESQEEYWTEYSSNLADLQARNIDGLDELVEKFDDGTTQGAAMVASLADMTNEEIEDIVREYGIVEDEEDNYANQHAELTTQFTEQSQKVIDEFVDWVNQQEDLTQADKDYMLQMMTDYVSDVSALDEDYEGELDHLTNEQIQYAEDSINGMKGTSEEIVDDTQQKLEDLERTIKTTSNNLADDLGELCAAYDDVYQSCKESMEGMFGLWDEAEQIQAEKIDTLIHNQETQAEYWTQFGDNLENLYARDIDGLTEYVNAHSDATDDNVALIASLAAAEDDEVEHFLETVGVTEEGMNRNAQIVADNSTAMSESIDTMVDQWMEDVDFLDLSDESRENAIETLKGIVAGITDENGEVYANAEDLANTVENKIREKLNSETGEDIANDLDEGVEKGLEADEKKVEEASKSVATGVYDTESKILNEDTGEDIGSEFAEGTAEGVESEKSNVESSGSDIASAALDGMNSNQIHGLMFNSGVNAVGGFKDGIESSKETAYTKMESVAKQCLTKFKDNVSEKDFKISGQNVITGFINGLNDKTSNLYTSMQNLAKNALKTFNNELGVHSPSDETEWSAEKTIEGWVIGIDKNADEAEESMADLARESLSVFTEEYKENLNTMIACTNSLGVALNISKDIVGVFAESVEEDFGNAGMAANSISLRLRRFDEELLSTIVDVKQFANTTSLYKSGEDTINGFINGLNSQSSDLYKTMQNVAQTSLDKFNSTLGVHSPSTEAEWSAEMTIKGWLNGIDKNTRAAEESMKDLADDAMDAFAVSLDDDLATTATFDNLAADFNLGNAEVSNNETIYITMPIYTGKTYTKTEIVEIAMDGINHKQMNNYAARGVTL